MITMLGYVCILYIKPVSRKIIM